MSEDITAMGRATEVELEGKGPFLLPLLGPDVTFRVVDDVGVMQATTAAGQVLLLAFRKETLRTLGLELLDALREERVSVDPQDDLVSDKSGRDA